MDVQARCAADSIEEVIRRYQRMVFGLALSYTRSRADADDVFQEVFLLYYREKVDFNSEEHRKAWLINATVNYSKKVTGSTWRKKTGPLDEREESGYEFSSDDENLIYAALLTLPQKYRVVLHLFYFQQMPIDEISKALRMKAGTVKVQLLRGRELMREKLKGDFLNA